MSKPSIPSTLTLAEITALLGISRQAIDAHCAAGTLTRVGRDAYATESVAKYCENLREAGPGGNATSPARQRILEAKARQEEIKAGALENRYVPADQVEQVWAAIVGTIRSHLLAIPSKCAARVVMCKNAVEVQQLLRREIEEALLELSRTTFTTE